MVSERDDCDAHSSHFVSLNLQDEIAGYVRLVRPDAIQTFPFQTHCVQLLDGVTLPPSDQSAEISRLMVSSRYRRRHGDKLAGVNVDEDHLSDHERRVSSPQILLCMYRQMLPVQPEARHPLLVCRHGTLPGQSADGHELWFRANRALHRLLRAGCAVPGGPAATGRWLEPVGARLAGVDALRGLMHELVVAAA